MPNDIFEVALKGYLGSRLNWSAVRGKAQQLAIYLKERIPQSIIETKYRQSASVRKAAAGVSSYRIMPWQLRSRETMFTAFGEYFVFRASDLWVLSIVEPVFVTDHLYRRMIQRSSGAAINSPQVVLHNLSLLVPALVALGDRRRRTGRPALVSPFFVPWENGLAFGDIMSSDEHVDGVAPKLWDCKDGTVKNITFIDPYTGKGPRLFAQIRTFVDARKLRSHQFILKQKLEAFTDHHRPILTRLQRAMRLAAPDPYGHELAIIFQAEEPPPITVKTLMDELEEIIQSTEWRSEVDHSTANRMRFSGARIDQ
jgi:hypothetical protein